ncbi:MAG: cytochrome c [Litoreibacter sp.]|nr:cytochrome c [Litoreibacter sp.]
MWGKLFRWGVFLGLIGAACYWVVTRPTTLDLEQIAALAGDAEAGQIVFIAAGCASCHARESISGDEKLVLAGGQRFPSDFGTFVAPNISMDPDHGIGSWNQSDFLNAVVKGVSPTGKHYFPAFPYTSYNKMTLQDGAHLWAYMQTLSKSGAPSQPHEIAFPFSIRRNLGGWKFLFLSQDWVAAAPTPTLERGRYLVEALGHCAECHTPRNALGALDTARWMQGAPDPSGKGRVPGITPAILGWVEADIIEYLFSGFTPEFDTAGGHMANVIENTAQLPKEDREAIAAYLLALPN